LTRAPGAPIGASIARIALRRVGVEASRPDACEAMARMAARLAAAAQEGQTAPESRAR
jgi:hypothetical protein